MIVASTPVNPNLTIYIINPKYLLWSATCWWIQLPAFTDVHGLFSCSCVAPLAGWMSSLVKYETFKHIRSFVGESVDYDTQPLELRNVLMASRHSLIRQESVPAG